LQAGTSQPKVYGIAGGAVELYYSTEGKKFETSSTGATVTGTLVADGLTVDTNTLYVDSANNRVGIGTTSPERALHVSQSVPIIRGTDTDTSSYGEISFSGGSVDIRADGGNASAGSYIIFRTDGSEIARFNDSGQLGIGTTSPSTKLSVEGTSADVASFIRGNNAGSGQIHLGNSDGYVRVGGANGSFSVYNSTNTSARLYIDNTGKVGIGNNPSPTEELDVTGDGAFSGNVTITGNLTVNGTTTTVNSTEVNIQNAFVFEGATADEFETTLTVTDPTADRTITLPDATGTVVLQDSTDTLSNKTLTTPEVNTSLNGQRCTVAI
jgi:hypothetical protein